MGSIAQAFLSYTHRDDDNDAGQIRRLADRIAGEFGALSGKEIDVYVDAIALKWGDEWNEELEAAVQGATFLIPVVTPSYFSSQACRDELLSFSAKERLARRERLVMPVYWIDVPELSAAGVESDDEAVALVAKYQWLDMRDVRLEDETSAPYRKAVNRAAKELVQRVHDMESSPTNENFPVVGASSPSGPEVTTPVRTQERLPRTDEEEDGLLEVLANLESDLPRLGEIVHGIANSTEAIGTIFGSAEVSEDSTAREKLAIAARVAAAVEPEATRFSNLGREFASLVVRIDPGVLLLLEMSDDQEAADGLAQVIIDTNQEIANALDDGAAEFLRTVRELAKTSRVFQRPAREIEQGLQGMRDGQRRFAEWADRATERLES